MARRLGRIFFSLILTAFLFGCDSEPTPADSKIAEVTPTVFSGIQPAGSEFDYVYDMDIYRRMKTPMNLMPPLKSDANDDVRWKNPQNYSITIAPPNIDTVRPMVEWEPMKSIVMQWPGGYLSHSKGASSTFLSIAYHTVVAAGAEVWIVTNPEAPAVISAALIERGLTQEQVDTKVKYVVTAIDAIWTIDFGPLPIVDTATNTYAFTDFRYYHERPLDDGISTILGRAGLKELGLGKSIETYRMPSSTEGGTFQATTDGVCFTGTRQIYNQSCMAGGCDANTGGKPAWHQGGNKYVPIADVQDHPQAKILEDVWAEYIGCKDLIVTHSITDDGTGHLDMYFKVVDDNTILIGEYKAPFDPNTPQEENAKLLDETAVFLENYVKPDGSKFTVHRMVMPGHRSTNDGPVPFTYLNSTFINGVNLWPATEFADWEASRAEAEAKWKEVMPDYTHIWIDSTELSFWSGAIHCITRTVPDLPVGVWTGEGTCDSGTDMCQAPANGYDGECTPNATKSDICWGPEWLCDCNDCDSGCGYVPPPLEYDCFDGKDDDNDGKIDCDDSDCINEPECSVCPDWMTYEGCCEGDFIKYCDGGSRKAYECEYGCGWSEAGFYDCAGGDTNAIPGQSDPSGTHAIDCGPACVPACDGKTCGDNGCGGVCGTCSATETCNAGICEAVCEDACTEGEMGCDGTTAWICSKGELGCYERKTGLDCGADGKTCSEGSCQAVPVEPPVDPTQPGTTDGGCSGATNQSSGLMWPMAILLLGATLLWRRRQTLV